MQIVKVLINRIDKLCLQLISSIKLFFMSQKKLNYSNPEHLVYEHEISASSSMSEL